jgi:hypothetical protein
MGYNNEIREYFVHSGFLVDPYLWALKYDGAPLGDLAFFAGFKVGDTYETMEGRTGEKVHSLNRVLAIS